MRRSARKSAARIAAVPQETQGDSSDQNDDEDFQDSGSEASIPDNDEDEENDDNDQSDDDFEEVFVKKSASKAPKKIQRPTARKSKTISKPTNAPRTLFRKLQAPKIPKSDDEETTEPISVKDLTEQEKLLPEFLNLSESDSDSDEETGAKKNENLSQVPIDYASFIKKETQELNVSSTSPILNSKAVDNQHKVERLSSSESENEMQDVENNVSNINEKDKKIQFKNLHDHTQQIEETKKTIELYNLKHKNIEEKSYDIGALLAMGEEEEETKILKADIDEDNMSDSDVEDLEEVKDFKNQPVIPKGGIQVVVDLPTDGIKKKKKLDLEMMLKRRINKTKKEYQGYMHKVHVLAWIAHGNFVNKILNNASIMASSLSLIPSEHCYPSGRVNIKYVEQITKWYSDTIIVKEDKNEFKFRRNKPPLLEILLKQIAEKVATTKKNKVLTFVSMLRALGVKCRVTLSFQVIPQRPPATELCSLAIKNKGETSKHFKKSPKAEKSESISKSKIQNPRNDSKSNTQKSTSSSKSKAENLENNSKQKTGTKKNDSISKVEKLESNSKIDKSSNKLKIPDKPKNSLKSNAEGSGNVKKLRSNVKLAKNDDIELEHDDIAQLDGADDKIFAKKKTANKVSEKKSKTDSAKSKSKILLNNKNEASSSSKFSSHWDSLMENVSPVKKEKRISHRQLNQALKLSNISEETIEPPSSAAAGSRKITQSSKSQLSKINNKASNTAKKKPEDKEKNTLKVKISTSKAKTKTPKSNNSIEEKTQKNKRASKVNDTSKYFEATEEKPITSAKKLKMGKNLPVSSKLTENNPTSTRTRNTRLSKKNLSQADDSDEEKSESINDPKLTKRNRKESNASDADFQPAKKRISRLQNSSIDRRVLSTDDEHSPAGEKKIGVNVWCEVYAEEEEQWISVDAIKGQVHCVNQIYSRANHPVVYVISWDTNNYIKDVTRRYVPHWNTVTRKLRVDSKWYEAALKPWMAPLHLRDRREDQELDRLQLDAPLPQSISEFKNHPLYALKRHLLKFEVIYPPDAMTLGFVKNEPVYARECVHTCRSRETWVKEAKVVRPNEQPYKIVKARPKYDRLSGKMITDIPLEIFGPWQVQDYVPPKAVDGVIPRNPYGNVELFKACMLPEGTVHIVLPGLNKVAKKLGIDCAPAMVGFDYHSGWSHPVYDGFVVCSEFKDQITEAWEEEQEAAEQRATDKLERRVYGNWKRLIRGLLIRERLQKKYDFNIDPKKMSAGTSGVKKRIKGQSDTTTKKQKTDE